MVNIYNNTYHSTFKMKPADIKSNTYIDFNVEKNDEDPKFEVDDHVRILQYKSIFTNTQKVFVIKKIESTIP